MSDVQEYNNSSTPQSTLQVVSIIIPVYNAEKYIGECLDSVLLQTFQSFEVIVVDDCSTDNSRQIAESYLEKFNDSATDNKFLAKSCSAWLKSSR